MFKEVKVIKSRGALGTGFTYAPELLFELYLAIKNFQNGGKPSTWFPPVELVELYGLRKRYIH